MSIVTMNAPAWYNEDEVSCFEKVKNLARSISSARAVVVEHILNEEAMEKSSDGTPIYVEHNQVLIECCEELSDKEILCISEFNKEGHELLVAFSYESECVEGERYYL